VQRAGELFSGRQALVVTVWSSMSDAVDAGLLAIPADVAREAAASLDEEAAAQAGRTAAEGAELARTAGLDARDETAKSIGNVWSTILDIADREDAAVVVVGSRGLSGVKSLLLGSVSGAIANNSERPVLVVHP
jgi:nucleotide-binding universal stress UspA family protein